MEKNKISLKKRLIEKIIEFDKDFPKINKFINILYFNLEICKKLFIELVLPGLVLISLISLVIIANNLYPNSELIKIMHRLETVFMIYFRLYLIYFLIWLKNFIVKNKKL